jgi:hypothetical protein
MKPRGIELQIPNYASPTQLAFTSPIQVKLIENPALFMLRNTARHTVGETQAERQRLINMFESIPLV